MTPALRKYHRKVWFFMAGFLPVLFVAAIVVIPERQPMPAFKDTQAAALPEVLNTIDLEKMTLNLRANHLSGERQLEILIKKPLTLPAALVYISDKKNTEPAAGVLLGALGPAGYCRFRLHENNQTGRVYVTVFDALKNQLIQQVEL